MPTCKKCLGWLEKHPESHGFIKCRTCGYSKPEKSMITLDQYLMGRDVKYAKEYTNDIKTNAEALLEKVNSFLAQIGVKEAKVNSGWRPKEVNDATKNAAAHSKHEVGSAVDIADHDGKLWEKVLANLDLAKNLGLFFEDKRWTTTWVHMQLGKPGSGHRIFIPSSAPASCPGIWDGEYDRKKYDA